MEHLRPDDPQALGGYRLLGRLGAGGMGQVYLGRSTGGRMVAVKRVHAGLAEDPLFRQRFRREVEAARRVGGGWTAPVLDADTESGTPWVATGYVPGPTLADAVERHGRLPEASVLALASGLARALQAVHACGLIHRDLKPSNVLVTIDGPRVIDFGIARSVDASVATRTGALVGSPAFMSPEQARGGELGPASDVFSLGSVLAYAATGRRAFGEGLDGLHAVIFQVAQGEPQLDGLSGPVRGVVEACLAKAPQHRPTLEAVLGALPPFPSNWLPAEVVAELGRHAAGLLDLETPVPDASPVPHASPAPPATGGIGDTPTRPPRRRPGVRRWLIPLIGAAAVIGAAVTALAFDDGSDGDRAAQPKTSTTKAAQPKTSATKAAQPKTSATKKAPPPPQDPLPATRHDVVLKNVETGLCADLPAFGGGEVNGRTQVYICNGSADDNQRWNLVVDRPGTGPNDSSLFTIRNSKDTYCLDLPDFGAAAAGSPVVEWNCDPGSKDNQMWYLEKKSDGYWIRNMISSGLCLGVADKDAPLTISSCNSPTGHHLWSIG